MVVHTVPPPTHQEAKVVPPQSSVQTVMGYGSLVEGVCEGRVRLCLGQVGQVAGVRVQRGGAGGCLCVCVCAWV